MADVQLEHGHIRLANRLAEAILAARFTGTQVRILLALVRLTYGWKRKTVLVSLDQLARFAGLAYTGGFRRALDELLRAGVVVEVARGHASRPSAYAIQKDHEQWGEFSIAAVALSTRWATRPAACDEVLPPQGGAPTGADPMPPQGQTLCPRGGTRTDANSRADRELQGRKDSERHRKTTTTTADASDPALSVVLTAAANRGITEQYGEQPCPLRHDAGTSLAAAEKIAKAGVPGDFARDAMYAAAKRCTLEHPPRSLGYFAAAVIDRWRAAEERRAAAALDVADPTEDAGVVPIDAARHPRRRPGVAERTLANGRRALDGL